MASISKQSKETQLRNRKFIAQLLKLPGNTECMDCRAHNPTWASINLGVFLCIRCSGLHRQVGVHITQVRSCDMDLWEPEQIGFIQRMGNQRAKKVWEAKLPPNYGKPSENENSALVLQWIRSKYERKKYAAAPDEISRLMAQFAAEPLLTPGGAGGGGQKQRTGATRRQHKHIPSTTSDDGNNGSPALGSPSAYSTGSPSAELASNANIPDAWGSDDVGASGGGGAFSEFMSPAIQSPRDGESGKPQFPTSDSNASGGSAFGFMNAGGANSDKGNSNVAGGSAEGSAFSFVNSAPPPTTTTTTTTSADNDDDDGNPPESPFAFINTLGAPVTESSSREQTEGEEAEAKELSQEQKRREAEKILFETTNSAQQQQQQQQQQPSQQGSTAAKKPFDPFEGTTETDVPAPQNDLMQQMFQMQQQLMAMAAMQQQQQPQSSQHLQQGAFSPDDLFAPRGNNNAATGFAQQQQGSGATGFNFIS